VDLLIAELDQTMQGLSDTERALLSPRILVLRRGRDELERDAR
jgi:hypothetical protein